MKQFRVDYRRSSTPRFFGLAAATERYGSEVTKGLDALAVGQSCVDCDGDTWTRLPDVGDAPQAADPARKERRERIATAALAGILSHPGRRATVAEYASGAVALADALIDALDAAE